MQSRFINPFRLPLSPYLNCNAACQASTGMCLNAFHRHCVAYLPNASQINALCKKSSQMNFKHQPTFQHFSDKR